MNAVLNRKPEFVFGTCSVPDGERGDWKIDRFTLTKEDVQFENMRNAMRGHGHMRLCPGVYTRLSHKRRGVVMSNTGMEVLTNRTAFRMAQGSVLINGLGLGMLVEGILSKDSVTSVRVIEIDADVIALVAPHFSHDPRFQVIHADAMEYRPEKGERFDYVWHDIWDAITGDNLDSMKTLARRYGRRADDQGFWARELIERDMRRYG